MKKPAGRMQSLHGALRRARTSLARCLSRESTGPRPQNRHSALRILSADDGRNELARARAESAGHRRDRCPVLRRRRGRAAAPAARARRIGGELGGAPAGSRPASSRARDRPARARGLGEGAARDGHRRLRGRGCSSAGSRGRGFRSRRRPLVRRARRTAPRAGTARARPRPAARVAGGDRHDDRHDAGARPRFDDDPARPLGGAVSPSLRRARLVPAGGLPPLVRLGCDRAQRARDARAARRAARSTETPRPRRAR